TRPTQERPSRSSRTSRKPTTSVLEKRRRARLTSRYMQRRNLLACAASSVRSTPDKRGCASTTISTSGDAQVRLHSPATRSSSDASTSAPTAAESSTATGSERSKKMRIIVTRCLIVVIVVLGLLLTSHAANVTVNVDYNNARQTIEGFGASATWVANDIDSFSPAKQTQILDLLYKTSQPGAGLSWVRVGSFLCNFNPSPGVFDWNYWGIQSGMRWLQRVNAG